MEGCDCAYLNTGRGLMWRDWLHEDHRPRVVDVLFVLNPGLMDGYVMDLFCCSWLGDVWFWGDVCLFFFEFTHFMLK